MELFPHLPNDLGRQCLLRVSYESHPTLTAVCRSWKATVRSPDFYQNRKILGTSQQVICLFELREYRYHFEFVVTVFDPLQHTWETLPPLPHFPGYHDHGIPLFCDAISVNQKLVLMGGFTDSHHNILKTLFIYDFSSAKWSRGADMPTARKSPAFSVSPEGLVYIAGGTDDDGNTLLGAEVYSVEEDEWKVLPDMRQERDNCLGVFKDGKFFVTDLLGRSAEVYDPKRGAWTTIREEQIPALFDRVISSSDGSRFFSVENQEGVMEYDSNENAWRAVCSLPETIEKRGNGIPKITSSVAWRDRIFVSGLAKGTRTDEAFYMLKPRPIGSEAGAQAETFGQWDAIERPRHSHEDYVPCSMFAVTVEI